MDKEIRFCKLCAGTEVENEIHFLHSCTAFDDLRKEQLKPFVDALADVNEEDKYEVTIVLLSSAHIMQFAVVLERPLMYRTHILYKSKGQDKSNEPGPL